MSVYNLPEAERKAYFRANKQASRAKQRAKLTPEEYKEYLHAEYKKRKARAQAKLEPSKERKLDAEGLRIQRQWYSAIVNKQWSP